MEKFPDFVESCFPEAVYINADSVRCGGNIYPLCIPEDGHYVLLPYDQLNVTLGSYIERLAERESSHDI